MSQFPHDEFVKEHLPELYQDYGIVTLEDVIKASNTLS